jgi:hypothetical protein
MKENLNIYIGYDSRQDKDPLGRGIINPPYEVCKASIRKYNSEVKIIPIKLDELIAKGIYGRDNDPLASTEFTYSRFLVPYLNNYEGIALFCDSDFLWQSDVSSILDYYNSDLPIMCCKHEYIPANNTKMDGLKQSIYPRKNWSSLMLFNCSNQDCKKLTPEVVNTQTPKYLHRMNWTIDKKIGSIPLEYNWLEGDYNYIDNPKAIHYTNGGPWHDTWDGEYRGNWEKQYKEL